MGNDEMEYSTDGQQLRDKAAGANERYADSTRTHAVHGQWLYKRGRVTLHKHSHTSATEGDDCSPDTAYT